MPLAFSYQARVARVIGENARGFPLPAAAIEFLALRKRPDKALRLVLGMEFVTLTVENYRKP
jgi:hypothetical protein